MKNSGKSEPSTGFRDEMQQCEVFVRELRNRGFEPDPNDRVQNLRGTEYEAIYIESILAALDRIELLEDRYGFVRMMGSTTTLYDPRKVIDVFNQLTNSMWKSAIVGSLAQSNPIGICSWFIERLNDNSDTIVQSTTAFYVSLSQCYSECRNVLFEKYSEFPLNALGAFERVGGREELDFLKQFNHSDLVFDEPEIQWSYEKHLPKVLKKLESRVKRAAKTSKK